MKSDKLNDSSLVLLKDAKDSAPAFDRPTYETQITEEDDRSLPRPLLQVNKLCIGKRISFSFSFPLSFLLSFLFLARSRENFSCFFALFFPIHHFYAASVIQLSTAALSFASLSLLPLKVNSEQLGEMKITHEWTLYTLRFHSTCIHLPSP